MTAEAIRTHAIGSSRAGSIFSLTLIAATILPFCSIALAFRYAGVMSFSAVLILIGSTHVFATSYLFVDPDVRRFFRANPTRMIAVPSVMVVAGMVILSVADDTVRALAMWVFFIYQAWHFGAQNIGVSSFISMIERGKPLLPLDKTLIKCGVVTGMLGVLSAMGEVFPAGSMLSSSAMLLTKAGYIIGFVACIPLTGVALWRAAVYGRDGYPLLAISLFLSITFLFTMYVTRNYTLGFLSFTVAHGLQYLIFLFVHSGNIRKQLTKVTGLLSCLLAPTLLLVVMLIGNLLWNGPTSRLVPAIVPSLTLAHFWIDQFLWKTRDRDQGAWIKSRFAAVLGSVARGPDVAMTSLSPQ